jgi:phosphatidylglycerol:prolipoprotein diacylglycerol transferase
MVIVFAILWRLRTRIRAPGVLLCVYLILTGAARFAVEFIRLNPKAALGLTLYQWISLALLAGGALCALRLQRRTASPQ